MDFDSLRVLVSAGTVGGGEPRTAEYSGTKALMLAVLDNAVHCYCGRSGRIQTQAEAWVWGRDSRSPFSFVVVCEVLGLDPGAVRRALAAWRQRSPRTATRGLRPNVRKRGVNGRLKAGRR